MSEWEIWHTVEGLGLKGRLPYCRVFARRKDALPSEPSRQVGDGVFRDKAECDAFAEGLAVQIRTDGRRD